MEENNYNIDLGKTIMDLGNSLVSLMEQSDQIFLMLDNKSTILYANKRWEDKSGYKTDYKKDLILQDICHPDYKNALIQLIHKVAETTEPCRIDTLLLTNDNNKLYLTGSIGLQKKDPSPYFIITLQDNSEKIKFEKASKAYFSISKISSHKTDQKNFYAQVHQEINDVIDARNFYLLLKQGSSTNFPFFIDDIHSKEDWNAIQDIQRALSLYTINNGNPIILNTEVEMIVSASLDNYKKAFLPDSLIGIPLRNKTEIIGVIVTYSYDSNFQFTKHELEVLEFLSDQLAIAIVRQKEHKTLQEQTARLNSIFESSNLLIWAVNKSFDLTTINQRFFNDNIFGNKDTTTIQQYKDAELVHYEPELFWQDKYKTAFEGQNQHFEIKISNYEGRFSWKEVFLNPVYMEDGSITEISGIAQDITEKKESEAALIENEEMFRNIFESFQDLYVKCDLKGNIQMVSPSAKLMIGYKQTELVNKNVSDYYLYNIKTKKLLKDLLRNGFIKNFELSLISKKGDIIPSICNINLLRNSSGKAIGFESVARDITKLKATNKALLEAKDLAERSLKSKEQFLANMSHEIRTPMTGVIGMIDLLYNTQLSEKQQYYLDTVKKSSETLLHIINDILDLSKIEAGKMELRNSLVTTKDLFMKLKGLFTTATSNKNIQLLFDINDQVPEAFIADEIRLIQVLSNLISNAIKFTPEKGAIHIKLLNQDALSDNKVELKFEIKDTGIGISPDDIDKLFNSFSQVDSSFSKNYKGTGLGLAISKQLCELMGGKIGVQSEKDVGSTFWFTIKTWIANKPIVKKDAAPKKSYPDLKELCPKILLVDDNKVNRMVASEILKKAGAVITSCDSGEKALAEVAKNAFDIILMDIQMPEMDGLETTSILKERHQQLPPILAMTAYSMKEDEEKFLNAGMDGYISKPLKPDLLINIIQSHLNVGNIVPPSDVILAAEEKAIPIMDLKVIERLIELGGLDLIQETLYNFEEETIFQLSEINASVNNDDYETILSHLHTIKGNAGTLGGLVFSLLAEELEEKIKKEQYKLSDKDLNELNLAFSNFKNTIIKYLNHSNNE